MDPVKHLTAIKSSNPLKWTEKFPLLTVKCVNYWFGLFRIRSKWRVQFVVSCIIYKINAPTKAEKLSYCSISIESKRDGRKKKLSQTWQHKSISDVDTAHRFVSSVKNGSTGCWSSYFAFDQVSTLRHHVPQGILLEMQNNNYARSARVRGCTYLQSNPSEWT